jgi:hypothetical protein
MLDAHQRLLADGGGVSFWEDGWLEHQVQHWHTGRSERMGGTL